MSKPAPSFAADAELLLGECTWPGNVRELRNVVERAVLLAPRSEILAADLNAAAPDTFADASAKAPPPAAVAEDAPEALRERLREVERKHIEDALAKTGGNQSRAATLLGISRYALMHRMEVFGLVRPRKKR